MVQRAFITPEVIQWARDSSNLELDVAASKLGVKPEKLSEWESGESRPTVRQARELAKLYRRPLPVFYLPKPPKNLGFSVPKDYRRVDKDQQLELSPELIREIRRIEYLRNAAIELSDEIPKQPKKFIGSCSVDDGIKEVALKARKMLRVTVGQQDCTKDKAHYSALNLWKGALEDIGVLVFHLKRVEVSELRGLAIAEKVYPVIAVNGSDSVNGRIFTLMHEFIHLLVGKTGLSNPGEILKKVNTAEAKVEVFCNKVAAELLMPEAVLLSMPFVQKATRNSKWSDDLISMLAHKFGVSRSAFLLRLVELKKTPQVFFEEKQKQYAKEREANKKTGFITQAQDVMRLVGQPMLRIAINAYYRDSISSSELSSLLGAKLKHLPALQSRLEGYNTLTGSDR